MKPILEIKNISKKFCIHHETQPYLSLRDSIINTIKSPFQKTLKSRDEDFYALKDISFDVMPGESVGIIGKNGAGKSTLLKILSKITPPSSGKIISRGRIASLLEVGTGFHPELSGRENIFMNGSILGMQKKEIIKNFDAIVDFSGVKNFIDTPLKHYSSGMQLRLAFAVAAFLENEILIIDEVLAVGDAEFQKKCMGKMEDVSKGGRTVLFVSHQMGIISQLCKNGVYLENGRVKKHDSINAIISEYLHVEDNSIFHNPQKTSSKIDFIKIFISNDKNEQTTSFSIDDPISIHIKLKKNIPDADYSLLFTVTNLFKTPVFSAETIIDSEYLVLKINKKFLTEGQYNISFRIHIPNKELVHHFEDILTFSIIDLHSDFIIYNGINHFYGSVFGNIEWVKQGMSLN